MKQTVRANFRINWPKSGLELVLKEPRPIASLNQDELTEFAQSLLATESTFERYQGEKHFKVWAALALHHYLDPERLLLQKKGRLAELKSAQYSLAEKCPRIFSFLNHLDVVLRDANNGTLQCIKSADDPFQCFTTAEFFLKYATAKSLHSFAPRPLEKELDDATPQTWPKHLQDQLDGMALWKSCSATEQLSLSVLVKFYKDRGYVNSTSECLATLTKPTAFKRKRGRPVGSKNRPRN